MTYAIDEIAREIALRRYGIPECLHVPIAAVDEHAITTYVGEILQGFGRGTPARALLVRAKDPPAVDNRFPIWDVEGSQIFHERMQVWVHHSYNRYRSAYRKALPAENIDGKILSHAMNRRVAALKGFQYVRLTPTSRRANSSSAFSEGWAFDFHSTPGQIAANRQRRAFIQYADLTDLMLMLDMNLGGGIMEAVNDGQKLVKPKLVD